MHTNMNKNSPHDASKRLITPKEQTRTLKSINLRFTSAQIYTKIIQQNHKNTALFPTGCVLAPTSK